MTACSRSGKPVGRTVRSLASARLCLRTQAAAVPRVGLARPGGSANLRHPCSRRPTTLPLVLIANKSTDRCRARNPQSRCSSQKQSFHLNGSQVRRLKLRKYHTLTRTFAKRSSTDISSDFRMSIYTVWRRALFISHDDSLAKRSKERNQTSRRGMKSQSCPGRAYRPQN